METREEKLTSRFYVGKVRSDFIDPESGKVLVKRGRRITVGAIQRKWSRLVLNMFSHVERRSR